MTMENPEISHKTCRELHLGIVTFTSLSYLPCSQNAMLQGLNTTSKQVCIETDLSKNFM